MKGHGVIDSVKKKERKTDLLFKLSESLFGAEEERTNFDSLHILPVKYFTITHENHFKDSRRMKGKKHQCLHLLFEV